MGPNSGVGAGNGHLNRMKPSGNCGNRASYAGLSELELHWQGSSKALDSQPLNY
jgi:hypothetical protein